MPPTWLYYPGIPIGHWTNKRFQVCKHSSVGMVIAQPAESLMGNVVGERKGIGLTFAANVHFCIQNYFFIKKIEAKMRVFCCCPMKQQTGIFGFAAE